MQELRYRLDLINVDPNSDGEVNDLVTTWHKQVIDILAGVAPRRELPMRKKRTSPWINDDIKHQIGRRDWLGKKLKSCSEEDLPEINKELDEGKKSLRVELDALKKLMVWTLSQIITPKMSGSL